MPSKDQQAPEAEEQSPKDQAGEEGSGVEEQEEEESAGDSTEESGEEAEEESEVELLGQEEFDKLKDDPAKLLKAVNRAATQKFQALAKERKELKPYASFIRALDKDPEGALRAVAEKMGLKIEGGTKAETEKAIESLADKLTESFRKDLGPEYEDLSDKLAVAVHNALQLAVPELTKSSSERIDAVINDAAAREAADAITAFTKKFPDWKQHEEAMVELSHKIPAGEGVSSDEYMEMLYYLVTRDRREGEGVKKVIQRMAKSAKAGNGKDSTVPDKQVAKGPPSKAPSFREAAAAAMRGERWE